MRARRALLLITIVYSIHIYIFWLTVLRMGDDRLVTRVVMESMEMAGKIGWLKDLERGLEGVGWRDVGEKGCL